MADIQKHTFHVRGMHCNACVMLTESELAEHPKVTSAHSNLGTRTVEIVGDFGNETREEIAAELSKMLSKHSLATTPEQRRVPWREFGVAAPLAAGFILLFVLLQRAGIVNLVQSDERTYGTAFVIGIIASLSTCMAVVGGLVLSVSANYAKKGERVRPQILFHVGRLAGFFILGGGIGALGAMVQFGQTGSLILGLVVGLVMLILGINLLDVFHWTKRLTPSMPKFIARRVTALSTLNHTLMPALLGLATFFLPCGFTQSMQIYTLGTGSFLVGALTMGVFALGTLPVLALVSFSSSGVQGSPRSGIFFKTAGLIVLVFALFNIIGALVAAGIIEPIFSF